MFWKLFFFLFIVFPFLTLDRKSKKNHHIGKKGTKSEPKREGNKKRRTFKKMNNKSHVIVNKKNHFLVD